MTKQYFVNSIPKNVLALFSVYKFLMSRHTHIPVLGKILKTYFVNGDICLLHDNGPLCIVI